MQRTVTVVATMLGAPRDYVSGATTWGQLKDLISRDCGDLSNVKVVVKETRNSLDRDDAVLPDGDFTLFINTSKIKAGGVNIVEVLEALREEYNDALDSVISRVEDGEFDAPEGHENVPTKSQGISREDLEFLRTM